mgnify:CR=1 FL=1
MKLGLKFSLETLTKENLRFAQQMGVDLVAVEGLVGESRLGDRFDPFPDPGSGQ